MIASDENISLDSPADISSVSTNMISLFMYSVRINPFLRNDEPYVVDEGGPDQALQNPPLPVDLDIVLTPFGLTRLAELEMIERIIQIFNDEQIITDQDLPVLSDEIVRIAPLNPSMDDVNKLWSIFPNQSYKTSLFYRLTPINIDSGRKETVTLVADDGRDISYTRL